MWFMHALEYYSAVKCYSIDENEPQNILLSESRQMQKMRV